MYKRTHGCQCHGRINTIECCQLWALLIRHMSIPYRLRLVVTMLSISDCLRTSSCVDTITPKNTLTPDIMQEIDGFESLRHANNRYYLENQILKIALIIKINRTCQYHTEKIKISTTTDLNSITGITVATGIIPTFVFTLTNDVAKISDITLQIMIPLSEQTI